MMIHHILDLPYELESKTCTCRKRPNWQNESKYDEKFGLVVHAQCGKPTQDKVIFQCAECEEYFISFELKWMYQSVICTARLLSSIDLTSKTASKIGDVFCDNCI